ncbi:MAG: energy transducer TonB [Bacteroidales bacterium]|nr:energy transducer TonB [Bacteroidales bacterium]
MHKKNKKFLKLPDFPGGNKALKEFIGGQLKYPAEALKNKIQGKVYVKYEVDDDGKVTASEIINGLGFGCDEEALRLVNMLKYNKVKNIGQRVKSTMKITINFNLPVLQNNEPTYKFNYIKQNKRQESKEEIKKVYNYTLNINQPKINE